MMSSENVMDYSIQSEITLLKARLETDTVMKVEDLEKQTEKLKVLLFLIQAALGIGDFYPKMFFLFTITTALIF